jgi:hypothetical protein
VRARRHISLPEFLFVERTAEAQRSSTQISGGAPKNRQATHKVGSRFAAMHKRLTRWIFNTRQFHCPFACDLLAELWIVSANLKSITICGSMSQTEIESKASPAF